MRTVTPSWSWAFLFPSDEVDATDELRTCAALTCPGEEPRLRTRSAASAAFASSGKETSNALGRRGAIRLSEHYGHRSE